jgi:hypothetical protein
MRRVVALVLAVVVLAGAVPVSAQEPTPTPVPLLVPEIKGVQDAALRSFAATGLRIASPISLAVEVIRFDSGKHGKDAIDTLLERQMQRLAQGGDTSGIKRASADKIGDETRAFGGSLKLTDTSAPIEEIAIGGAIVRRDEFVFVALVGSLGGDSITPALEIMRKIVDRQPGQGATPTDADGMRTGGLWDMLPTLDDVPEGLTFDEDRVPVPFDPLPGQDATPTPGTTAETGAASSSQSSEPVAFGHAARVAKAWSVKVVRTFDDPYQIDPSADWFNGWLDQNPREAGHEFFTVRLRLTNRGDQADYPGTALSFGLIGAAGYTYDGQYNCGNVPGQLSVMAQLAPGESLDANFCWIVRLDDIGSLVLYGEPLFSFDHKDRVYFAIRE